MNRGRVETFNAPAVHGAVSMKDVKSICTDTSFRDKPTRIAYESFIGAMPKDGRSTSIVWVARADVGMATVIGNLQLRLQGVEY